MDFNPEQQKAVDHFQGPCLVTATPGSGKTRTLTGRVIKLIRDYNVEPRNILCLTFTNKAAREMKDRIYSELGELDQNITIGTFHSIFAKILRHFAAYVNLAPNFNILDQQGQRDLMSQVARIEEYECSKDQIIVYADAIDRARESLVSLNYDPRGLTESELDLVRAYLITLDSMNCTDFTGILFKMYQLLKANPNIVDNLSKVFQYILVDEGQDTSIIQYEIIKKIAWNHKNCFIVADLDQSLYSWRGANPENLIRFIEEFDAKQIVLPRNYRSTAGILVAAQNLIRNNEGSEKTVLVSERGHGDDPVLTEHTNGEGEASWVVSEIKRYKVHNNLKWSDCAVLYRVNSMSRLLEMEARRQAVPYKIVGGFSFFDRSEIKSALSYLMFLANPNDGISFSRALTNPKRRIGDIVIGRIEKKARDEGISVLDACRDSYDIKGLSKLGRDNLNKFVELYDNYQKLYSSGAKVSDLAGGIIRDSGLYKHLEDLSNKDKDYEKRIDNVRELIAGIGEYEKGKSNITLTGYLQTIQLMSDVDESDDDDDVVQFSTIHSAKGLEWPLVHVVGAEEGMLPHSRAINETGHDEEERRLFYVAMTRAKDFLFINYSASRSTYSVRSGALSIDKNASRFILETGLVA